MSEESQTADELAVREEQQVEFDDSKSAPDDRATAGPFDVSEVPSMRPYVDLGGIKVQPREGLQLRLEVEDKTKRVLAVTMDFQGSLLQMQAFAAPKTAGLWNGIRRDITQQMAAQKAETREESGPRPRAGREDAGAAGRRHPHGSFHRGRWAAMDAARGDHGQGRRRR